jgi:hypothetical protein
MRVPTLVLSLALLTPSSLAFAQVTERVEGEVSVQSVVSVTGGQGEAQRERNAQASTSMTVRGNAAASATGTDAKEEHGATASSTTTQGTSRSAEHRSAVASFVQSLLRDADRDGGIGAEVRAVAQSQNDAASTTAEAILKVERRGTFLSFLFGTDWKTIGILRSQIARTAADAARLQAAMSGATDASVKTDLEAQLAVLTAEQMKLEAFVTAHESTFSVLGWFTKLFVRTSTTAP